MWFRRISLLVLLAAAATLAWWLWLRPPDPSQVYIFEGVRGPKGVSKIAAPKLARIADYERGSPHRLAVLVTDETSGWLGLVRTFKSHGVPITLTRDPERALKHRVIFVYPLISGRTLKPQHLRALSAHVRNGGTLLTFNLAGGGLDEVFGVTGAVEGRGRSLVNWTMPRGVPEEDQIRISRDGPFSMGSVGYRVTTGKAEATFDDGSAAVVCRQAGGRACVVGVDIGALAGRAMNGRSEAIGRAYSNTYEPSLDVLVRWVRDQYVKGEPTPWLLATAPAGREVSILLTHDIDFTKSVVNAKAYADLLTQEGVKGTFFMQTKYVRDYNDDIFFNDATMPYVRGLVRSGMDVGSHTVAHSAVLALQKLGSGRERYPRYRPFVQTRSRVKGATVLGELRVSKFLLEKLAQAEVVSFRPGELSYPLNLPEALQATGYRYSSSLTANTTLTHLPYQLTYERQNGALTPVYEFPVTVEDELPPALAQRYEVTSLLIGKIARHNGLVVILIHPNLVGEKLAFERRLIDDWRDRAWIGSLAEFGGWWTARDQAEVDVVWRDGRPLLTALAGPAIKDLAIRLPKAPGGGVTMNLRAGERRTIPIG